MYQFHLKLFLLDRFRPLGHRQLSWLWNNYYNKFKSLQFTAKIAEDGLTTETGITIKRFKWISHIAYTASYHEIHIVNTSP